MLHTLAACAMTLCDANSAGVSLLETTADGTELFRWVTAAGYCAPFINRTTPVDNSPSGVTLALDEPQLFAYPQRHFECQRGPTPEMVEELVVAIPGTTGPVGTLWIMSHRTTYHFDAEHRRIMSSLASFAGATLLVMRSRMASESRASSTEATERTLRLAEAHTDDFIAMVSHELHNPLAPIDAAIRTAQRLSGDNAPLQAAPGVAARQMNRLSRLVSDLLDTTRIRHGNLSVRPGYALLADIVSDAIASFQADITRLGQQLVPSQPEHPATVHADAARLTQVVANLLSNELNTLRLVVKSR